MQPLFSTVPNDRLGFFADQTLRSGAVAEFLELDKADVAKFSNVSVKSVRYDDKIPKPVREHLEQVALICTLVADFFAGDALKTALWFRTKNPLLGELSPRDMIRYGRMEKLRQIVHDARIANGMPEVSVTLTTVQAASHDAPRKAPSTAAN